jgi:EAL domain-containing protein (putative c-di-GMP-specific phosphodiesterase class I)/GGDEF domain-containing protein
MSSETISLYISRLLGLLSTASDLALEVTPSGEVVFAVDEIAKDAAQSKWVGRNWRSIIYADDHELVASSLRRLTASGRLGPYLVRRSGQNGSADKPALFSAVLMPHRAPNISISLSAAPVPPPLPSPKEPASAPATLDPAEFTRRLPDLVKRHRQIGDGVELAMVELLGRAGLRDQAGGGASAALLREITDLLRARSITGDMVAEITPERFLVLCAKKPGADMGALLLESLASVQADIQPKAVSLTVPRRLELSYAMRALRLTVEQFADTGVADGGEDLLSSFNGRLTQTFDSAKAFVSMTSSRNFELVYQPVASIRSGQIHHYEVLSRFPGGTDPFTLIKMAEELEIIAEFDIAVMQKAFSEVRQREQPPCLAINISARSFLQAGFIDRLLKLAAEETHLKGCLMFEITESAALSNLILANTYIQRLRSSGYPVCLDDFGSGATSFSYLQALAVDTVKIDGQYIKNLTDGSRDQVLVRHLAMLCKELKINTIAEMVETQSNVHALRKCDIDLIQGYFVGRPGPLPGEKSGLPARRVGITESWQ